ncbi:MAG: TIGR04282 family arsenosugar biosynthesis glycosyltransferase [Firmicutes bacterium]|nr:TIGR04282 family arsenosugar biosynthesis glycosyltransferase [Bacillota bacterium]
MRNKKAVLKIILFVVFAAVLVVVSNHFGLVDKVTQNGEFSFLRDTTSADKITGIIVYIIFTIIGCVVLALPGITFAVAAGMLFGPVTGIFACLAATTLGAMIAFIVGRFFLKDGVKPLLEKNKVLKKLLFSDNKKNDLILLMVTRLVPVFPYNLQNFAYGITDISFTKYSLYTFIFMFPGVSFYTIGAAGLTAEGNKWVYFMIAGVMALAVTALGVFIKKKYLGEEPGADNAVLIFTRVPLAGKTKTRLMPFLSGEECAVLHTKIIKKVYDVCCSTEADIIVFYTPEDEGSRLRKITGDKTIEMIPQQGKDLGERMAEAFRYAFEKKYKKAVLIGTDIPEITREILGEAFSALENNQCVINPTADGGFYLLGMKDEYTDGWQIDQYGNSSVFEATVSKLEERGISTYVGTKLQDIDIREDLLDYYRRNNGKTEDAADCVHCGKCTESCGFLKKYGIDLAGLAERPDLAYSCFLCGRCTEVCPKNIDGAAISLNMRARQVEIENKNPGKGYGGILFEKNPYKFAGYKKGKGKTMIFPGCNFPAFFPETMDRIEKIAEKHGFGVVYDCCQKPVRELGMLENADNNLQRLRKYIKENNVKEIVTMCPNCYHTLKDYVDIPVRSIYSKLLETGEGQKIKCDTMPVYLPCPERFDKGFMADIEKFVDGQIEFAYKDVECCGLGGCAGIREPDLARSMVVKAISKEQPLYTYCASCISNFRRKGKEDSYHLLPMILGVDEKVPTGAVMPSVNRIKRKF